MYDWFWPATGSRKEVVMAIPNYVGFVTVREKGEAHTEVMLLLANTEAQAVREAQAHVQIWCSPVVQCQKEDIVVWPIPDPVVQWMNQNLMRLFPSDVDWPRWISEKLIRLFPLPRYWTAFVGLSLNRRSSHVDDQR